MTSIRSQKKLIVLIVLFTSTFFLMTIFYDNQSLTTIDYEEIDTEMSSYEHGKWRSLPSEKIANMSTLGRILYLNEPPPSVDTNRTYRILVWKYGNMLERRHLRHFTNKTFDPFAKCSVRNCDITYKEEDLKIADIVIIHMQQTKSPKEVPKRTNSQQIFAFLVDESPYHIFLFKNKLSDYNNLFNWSMTYRMISDIPVPYGRTIPLHSPRYLSRTDFSIWNEKKNQQVLVAIMGSNCGGKNNRWKYVKELQKHIKVDVYGGCGTLKCRKDYLDCPKINQYKFYLAFENSNCDEYITEKVWWNSFAKESIPIVMGSSTSSYKEILPPESYINVDNFASPRDLANYLLYLNNTPNELETYFEWKRYFRIANEHGYSESDSYHYCRICEALNYNSRKEKVYNDLDKFMNKKTECHGSWDQ